MSLATHSIVGAVTAKVLSFDPILALGAAFLSHFVLDAIPHWDYKLKSEVKSLDPEVGIRLKSGRDFRSDLGRISLDFLIGLIFVLLFLTDSEGVVKIITISGALAGVAPDGLQFINGKLKTKPRPLIWFQRFHNFSHTSFRLDGRPIIGVISQLIFVAGVVWLATVIS